MPPLKPLFLLRVLLMSHAAVTKDSSEFGEFNFTPADFAIIASLVHKHTGIVLGPNKQGMVYTRLTRRLRHYRFESFKDYLALLNGPQGASEFESFVNAMTTNLTRFFREQHHFEHLAKEVIAKSKNQRLRIWSAGCSTGEEPYSIAMTMAEAYPEAKNWDAKILATDLDTNCLNKGSSGLYEGESFKDMKPDMVTRYFTPENTTKGQSQRAKDLLRARITFKQLNLLGDWPFKGPFDAIFCRNVMIYFDNPTKTELVSRYAKMLKPGGYLYIGHSETLLDNADFKLMGRTIYQRVRA